MTGILSIIQLVGQLIITNNICTASLFVYMKDFSQVLLYFMRNFSPSISRGHKDHETNARISRFNTLVQTDRLN